MRYESCLEFIFSGQVCLDHPRGLRHPCLIHPSTSRRGRHWLRPRPSTASAAALRVERRRVCGLSGQVDYGFLEVAERPPVPAGETSAVGLGGGDETVPVRVGVQHHLANVPQGVEDTKPTGQAS